MKTLPPQVHDVAMTRLRTLFPNSPLVREMNLQEAAPPGRCVEKGCPFPAHRDHRCRGHLLDMAAQYSVTPSVTAAAIGNLNRLVA